MAYRANLFDFGAVAGAAGGANASANDAAFLAAIADPTKIIEIEPEIFEVSQTVLLGVHGKRLVGTDGSDVFGTPSHGTVLKWCGAAGGTVVSIAPPNLSADLIAPGLSGVQIDGGGIASRAVDIRSARRPHVSDVSAIGLAAAGSTIAFYFGAAGTSDVDCVFRGEFRNLSASVLGASIGLLLDGAVTGGGHNTTFNDFYGCHVTYQNGFAYYLRSADDNHFFDASSSRAPGGTGMGLLLDGAGATYVMGNCFWGHHAGAASGGVTLYSRGAKARQNRIYGLTGVDTQPTITINAGSELYYDYSGGGYTATLAAEKAVSRVPKRQELTY